MTLVALCIRDLVSHLVYCHYPWTKTIKYNGTSTSALESCSVIAKLIRGQNHSCLIILDSQFYLATNISIVLDSG